jgi:hypothetical protein
MMVESRLKPADKLAIHSSGWWLAAFSVRPTEHLRDEFDIRLLREAAR